VELHGVDPRNIVLWGCSLAGGHVLQVGAEDPAIAAVIALTPAPDGLAALRGIMRRDGLLHATRLGALGVR
jgi:hypothetical protein